MKILITEDQLKNIVVPLFQKTNIKKFDGVEELKENWSQLSIKDKELVLELYKIINPDKSKKIDEGVLDWIQGGLDIAGIFDPTGIADLTNAVLYFGRGDVLFGMLSLVSVIPYAGDVVAKPVMLAAKAGAKEYKLFSAAVKTKNATKIADAANLIKGSSVGGSIFKFLESFGKNMGKTILNLLEKGKKIPVVGKFFTLIEEWIKVFTKAAEQVKVPTKAKTFEKEIVQNGKVIGKMKGALKGTERVAWKDTFKEMFKFNKGGITTFRDLSKIGKLPNTSILNWYKNVMRVPETRKLFGRTKLFFRFLDHLGLGNYVGPEELEDMVPNAGEKMADFMKTPEGQSAMSEDIDITSSSENVEPETQNILSQFFKSL